MNLNKSIIRYLDALAGTRLGLSAPGVFVPFAVFAAFQCALLLPLAFFTAGPAAPVMIPVVRLLGGEQALHYPAHFVQLPGAYQRVYLPLAATLGFSLWSYGVWLMVDRHVAWRTRPRPAFRRAIPHVLAIGVVFVGITAALGLAVGALVARVPPGIPARACTLAGIGVTACVQTLFVYGPIALRIRGGGAWRALRGSVAYAAGHFPETVTAVVTVLVVHAPVDMLLSRSDGITLRFSPEVVFQLLVGSVFLEMLTAYFLFAVTTGLALPEEGGMR